MYWFSKSKFISIISAACVIAPVLAVDVVAQIGSQGQVQIDATAKQLIRSGKSQDSSLDKQSVALGGSLQSRKEEPAANSQRAAPSEEAAASQPRTTATELAASVAVSVATQTPKAKATAEAPVAKATAEAPVAKATKAKATADPAAGENAEAKAKATVVKAAVPVEYAAKAKAVAGDNPEGWQSDSIELPEPAQSPAPDVYIAAGCMVGFGVLFVIFNQLYEQRVARLAQERLSQEGGEDGHVSDQEQLSTEGLPEDCYGMTVASLVRDGQHIANDSTHKPIRILRIVLSLSLMFGNMVIQCVVLKDIYKFSSAKAVGDIRKAYDQFERHMYNGHIYMTVNNLARGLNDNYFNKAFFKTLDEDVKSTACRIPFSQPSFLFILLLIWTLQIIGELRQTWQLARRLVLGLDNAPNMQKIFVVSDEEEEIIVRMPIWMKAFVALFICIPRLVIAMALCLLGCRWLSSTTDFQNLVLNAVGLEFLLLLKELMYNTLVSDRNKRDTARMQISVSKESAAPSPASFLSSVMLFTSACFWVYLYIFVVQQVLPDYRWDVQEVCVTWMRANYVGYDD